MNSNPAPLICHKCCFDGSKSWLRFAVKTVKCWISLHVNWRLEIIKRKCFVFSLNKIILFYTLLQVLMRILQLLLELLLMYPNVSGYTDHINRLLQHLIKQIKNILLLSIKHSFFFRFSFRFLLHNSDNYFMEKWVIFFFSSHAMFFYKYYY